MTGINFILKNIIFCGLALILITATTTKAENCEKVFATVDSVYEDQIRTVLFYPDSPANVAKDTITMDVFLPPIVSIDQSVPLLLEFDELSNTTQNYYFKILNCQADWTISSLSPIQFLDEYNELFISDRELSFNTQYNYVHYKCFMPKLKVSGNYILKVYRGSGNEDDLIITRRFIIYENLIIITPEIKSSSVVDKRNSYQQVDLLINYPNFEVFNPMQNLKLVIRQNNRWDNALYDLKPMYAEENNQYLNYEYYDLTNNFPGGNEYRQFDVRSVRHKGLNIAKIKRDSATLKSEESLLVDKSYARDPVYTQWNDQDGKYYVELYETNDTETQPDYLYVNFTLEVPPIEGKGKVYVFGALSDWKIDKRFEMTYNEKEKAYTARAFLKQGYYNYKYVIVFPDGTRDETFFENTFSMTENIYDFIAYYRPVGGRSDRVIGYISVTYLSHN